MTTFGWLFAALLGGALTVWGVRVATERPRPANLGGALVAAAALASTLAALAACAQRL
jgi:hypothetical protein